MGSISLFKCGKKGENKMPLWILWWLQEQNFRSQYLTGVLFNAAFFLLRGLTCRSKQILIFEVNGQILFSCLKQGIMRLHAEICNSRKLISTFNHRICQILWLQIATLSTILV